MSHNSAETAGELLPYLDRALERFNTSGIWWRGQACSEWSLQASICRKPGPSGMEQDFVNGFRRKALSRHHNCPPLNDSTGWLFLMQHYRLPTRLLDWSESLLIATYFAVNAEFTKPGAIWALSPLDLNEEQFAVRGIFEPDGDTVRPLIVHAFIKSAPKICKVAATSVKEIDPRMMVQLSAITIHGDCEPLDARPNNEKYLLKFEIPAGSKKRLLQLLYDLGVRESSIFPDLEHLAHDMSTGEYGPV